MERQMKQKKSLFGIVILLLMLAFTGCGVKEPNEGSPDSFAVDGKEAAQQPTDAFTPTISLAETKDSPQYDLMEVHFLDVGQGDCTLIKCGGKTMLIDTSTSDQGTAIQNYLSKNGVTKLDYLILTHPDADHIGSAAVIITKFEIDTVFISNFEKDNKTYQKMIQALDNKGLNYSTPEPGAVYSLGSAEFTILAPLKTYKDPNNASIALLLSNGENRFLFTGDAEESAEEDILDSGRTLEADVYHAGHHGSKTSSSEALLDAVSPEFAVISCEEGNSYGFPHAQTLNNLRSRGIKVYRTDEQGTILAVSDGSEITWNAAPSDTWKSGEPGGSAVTKVPTATTKPEEKKQPDTKNNEKTEAASATNTPKPTQTPVKIVYVLNTKTKKFHLPGCSFLPTSNGKDSEKSREELINEGYDPCKKCNP